MTLVDTTPAVLPTSDNVSFCIESRLLTFGADNVNCCRLSDDKVTTGVARLVSTFDETTREADICCEVTFVDVTVGTATCDRVTIFGEGVNCRDATFEDTLTSVVVAVTDVVTTVVLADCDVLLKSFIVDELSRRYEDNWAL